MGRKLSKHRKDNSKLAKRIARLIDRNPEVFGDIEWTFHTFGYRKGVLNLGNRYQLHTLCHELAHGIERIYSGKKNLIHKDNWGIIDAPEPVIKIIDSKLNKIGSLPLLESRALGIQYHIHEIAQERGGYFSYNNFYYAPDGYSVEDWMKDVTSSTVITNRIMAAGVDVKTFVQHGIETYKAIDKETVLGYLSIVHDVLRERRNNVYG